MTVSKSLNLPDRLVLCFDGACTPKNPGGWATYGWTLSDLKGKELASGMGVASKAGDPRSTNNFAEYCALGFGLRHLADLRWRGKLLIKGDSQLVIRQLTGRYGFKKQHLKRLCLRCQELIAEVATRWSAKWVPRDQNERCDELSKRAYDRRIQSL